MPAKIYNIDGVGEVAIYKRRGSKRLNLRISGEKIRVTQPLWLPYNSGVQFAISNKTWILNQRLKQPDLTIHDGLVVGKARKLSFEPSDKLRTKITTTNINIFVPPHIHIYDAKVQSIAKTTIKRALKAEAELVLPNRLLNLANSYDFKYKTVSCKSMRTRWGSCNSKGHITLNIYLMMVPWELIDYVLLHELAHTKNLNHGPKFWQQLDSIMPDYKDRRKQLKSIQHAIAPLY